MSRRNCKIAHNDARWRADCWQPVRQRLIELGHETEVAVPELNRGGCGLFAALVGKRLQALGYRVRLLISGSGKVQRSLNTLARHVPYDRDAWHKHGIHYIAHVMIRVYGEVFDSRGFAPVSTTDPTYYGTYYKGSISPDTGMAMAEDVDSWNSDFNYSWHRPTIEALINKYLPIEGNNNDNA